MPETTIRIPDTPGPFRAWLESLPAAQVVGRRGKCASCPLATFLHYLKADFPSVSRRQYWLGDGSGALVTPNWAFGFIRRVDAGGYDRPITAAACLALLEGLPE